MRRSTDVHIVDVSLWFLPVTCLRPLTFGGGTVNGVTCARVAVTVEGRDGRRATGWGETPLNVQWAWPSVADAATGDARMRRFCIQLTDRLRGCPVQGHPFHICHHFMSTQVPALQEEANLPSLAATVCMSPFDLALYDAFGVLHGTTVFSLFGEQWMNNDLAHYYHLDARGTDGASERAAMDIAQRFRGIYPGRYLAANRRQSLPVWHLVGYSDRLEPDGSTAPPLHTLADATLAYGGDSATAADAQGLPDTLRDWITRDGIRMVKIKLHGQNIETDAARVCAVFKVASALGVESLSLDLNGTAVNVDSVHHLFDAIEARCPAAFKAVLYVEEPVSPAAAVTSESRREGLQKLARRKPLFMDESAVNWQSVRMGLEAGWNGVSLKTCKTLTGSLLSLCWAREHGAPIMVQDLTNPMLAQLAHLAFAAHARSKFGVESNNMQFYPHASEPEARVHPGAFRRSDGMLDLSTMHGPGFGYRITEIRRDLPERVA